VQETGLTEAMLEALLLKALLQHGNCTAGQLAQILCLARSVIAELLEVLRAQLLVCIKSAAGVHDFVFQLSDAGYDRARRHSAQCRFVGPAPVPLADYVVSVARQSLQRSRLDLERLNAAFGDLVVQPQMLGQIAQALNDGRGLFLYGNPGNGKTSIAERVCNAYGPTVWIPQIIEVGGEMIRLFDPSNHQIATSVELDSLQYDHRWVQVRRPTIVVGGELTLDQLETRFVDTVGISESPVHLKSNCGTLVIDDFGRQRVSSSDILNRMIVPLEKQVDYLNLPSGRQIQVPFDQLLVFSTNLQPRDLVDEAFLRRIPYKIQVFDPTQAEFCRLIDRHARQLGFEVLPGAVEHLIETHYTQPNRPLRFCHPRDLLRQAKNFCEVYNKPRTVTAECFDVAVRNYFAVL
jgi:predicted ATPase with chaperone activity